MRRGPEELLCVEAITMFLAKAAGIQARDLTQRRQCAAEPPEPTHTWVALGAPCAHTDDPDHRDWHLAQLREMQLAPDRHLNGMAVGIAARPVGIGRPVGAGVRPLEARAIQRRAPPLMWLPRRRWAIHDPIPTGPEQLIGRQAMRGLQPRRTTIPTVQHDADGDPQCKQQWQHLAQLGHPNAGCRLGGGHAAAVEDEGGAAHGVGQDDQGRELPAWADGGGVGGQVAAMHQRAVFRGMDVGAQNTAHIHPQHQACPDHAGRQVVGEQALQRRTVDPAIFQRFVQAGPGALEAGRLRQLDEAAGVCVGQQRIGEVEQRVAGTREAGGGEGVAELRQDGKIHRRTSLSLSTQRVRPRAGQRKVACPFIVCCLPGTGYG